LAGEHFLSRWARLKQEAAKRAPKPERAQPQSSAIAPEAEGRSGAEAGRAATAWSPAPELFDPASLPPLEAIGPGSDIAAFLSRNVPAELTRAALRRAWSADPAIRDFVGLAENSWDFNAPDGVPGFSPMRATDDIRKLFAHVSGEKLEAPPEAVATATGEPGLAHAETQVGGKTSQVPEQAPIEPHEISTQTTALQHSELPATGENENPDAAVQDENTGTRLAESTPRQSHGGALPQ
jgi:Protein of unknown function (DUF3306)